MPNKNINDFVLKDDADLVQIVKDVKQVLGPGFNQVIGTGHFSIGSGKINANDPHYEDVLKAHVTLRKYAPKLISSNLGITLYGAKGSPILQFNLRDGNIFARAFTAQQKDKLYEILKPYVARVE